jgi:hypothetical protein
VQWVGVLLCCVAAYRLVGTPLQMVAAAVAVASVCCSAASSLAPRAASSRVVTGLQHVLAALGGFFLFVSMAMR